jgi:hypothetical protein
MKKHVALYIFLVFLNNFNLKAQTGPNNASVGVNQAGVGTLAWTNPDRIYTSNNMYATCAAIGTSNYLVGTGFGFAIPGPAAIDGIQLDIEKSSTGLNNIAILNTWSTGTTKTVNAGTNRYLLVVYSNENGSGTRDLTGLTWGGVAMTQLGEVQAGTAGGFIGRVEVWGLNEAGIAAGVGTALVATYGAYTPLDYCEIFSSISFTNVDQIQPVTSLITGGAAAATNPHQLPSAFTPLAGGVSINAVGCGNPGTYTINSGYTEGTDATFAAGTGSGATLQTAHELNTTAVNQPSCTFSAAVNRWFMIGLHLQRARNLDNIVSLVQGGTVTGNNYALTTTDWPTADAYTSYGGATDLWGTAWALADVNAANFGAALSAIVQNGTARVDHFRMTVWSHSTLPVELLDFTAEKQGDDVLLKWVTASEINNDYFILQRSSDGITFEDVTTVDGAGNSNSLLYYSHVDENPLGGTSYYRLKQVDFDGAFEYSDIKAVSFNETSILVYPNPSTNGLITIYNHQSKINEVTVYSADMKLVKVNTYSEEENPIVNIEHLADGTYFMVIKLETETRVVKVMKTSITR